MNLPLSVYTISFLQVRFTIPTVVAVVEVSIYVIAAIVVLGFLAVVLIIAFIFWKMGRTAKSDSLHVPSMEINQGSGIGIRRCSECGTTYTDETINFCLRDGTNLNIFWVPASTDPEETRVIKRNP